MAWELMNEPQLSNDYDRKAGIPPGSITSAWVWEIAAFIREVDGRRHLVSVGDEGWRSDIKGFGGDWAWINDGTKGIDAATNVNLPEIDFMTLHVYAPNWGFAVDKYHWLLQNFVADRAALAAVANKPIVLEVKRKEVDFFFFFSRLQGNEKKRKSSLSLSLSLSVSETKTKTETITRNSAPPTATSPTATPSCRPTRRRRPPSGTPGL